MINRLKNNCDRSGIFTQSGVYRLKCDDCDSFYIGETGRAIRERTSEHRRAKQESAFGRHLLNTGHKSRNDENIKVLHTQRKGFKLTLLEAYEIWKQRGNGNLLNEQVELRHEPLFKTCR